MGDNVKIALPGYAKYKGKGFHTFILHRISGLGTIVFLTLHITTTATVFYAPQWYNVLVEIFRNPIIMIAEIILAFFVIYHSVNGLRIAYVDLIRPDVWKKKPTSKLKSSCSLSPSRTASMDCARSCWIIQSLKERPGLSTG
ncbi:MAG: succinate dehydrogenase, cytochrome b556 subunit [Anaerolineales bacterium]